MEIIENNISVCSNNNVLEVSEPQVISEAEMKLYIEEFQMMELFDD